MTVTRRAASAFLMVAGVYQWTPLKHACLATCQSPLAFIQKLGGFRGDPSGAVAVLAGFALLEKIARIGPWFLRGVGAVLILVALALIR
jgi:predicted metal-binding membrane protein